MLLDKQNMFVNAVNVNGAAAAAYIADPLGATNFGATITANIATAPSASQGSIDLGLAMNLPRRTTGLTVMAIVSGATFTGVTAVLVEIFNSATAGAVTTLVASSGTLTVSATVLFPGYEIPIEIPDSVKLTLRYLVCRVTTTGAATSATFLDIGLVPDGDRQTSQV